MLTDSELHELTRWNTPTIYNGWEQLTAGDATRDAFNLEETRDFMPQMGPMCGWAVTCVIQPSDRALAPEGAARWAAYRCYLASVPGPKVAIVQDLDKPRFVGAGWGEVNGGIHRALGCVGAIIDGCIRDLDEMNAVGFKALAARLAIGHACAIPVRWGGEVEVFGRKIAPGQLIHADKHGFLAVPPGEERGLLDAARFMDSAECRTVIPAARHCAGLSAAEICARIDAAGVEFGRLAAERFGKKGEW